MLKFLIPKFSLTEFIAILKVALLGAFISGFYGFIHDQVTYSISSEYFTKLKFNQFSYADFGLSDRAFAGIVGFLATWWVGFFSGWFTSRILIARDCAKNIYRKSLIGFACIFFSALLGGGVGYCMGIFHDGNYNNWQPLCRFLKVTDIEAFVRVAYIHNAGYIGAGLGFILLLLAVFKSKVLIKGSSVPAL